MNVLHTTLYWNCAHMLCWNLTSVTRSTCIIRWSSDCWDHSITWSSNDDVLWTHVSVSTSPSCACIDVLHNWAPYLFSVHINHKVWVCPVKCSSERWAGICSDLFWTSCLNKQSQAVCMRPNYIKLPYMLALLLCTSEHCIWTGRICCGCSAHQSQGLSVSPDQAVTEGLSSRFHHQLMMFCEQNVSVRSHHTQQVSLAVLFCTSERCTLFQSTSVLCVESDEAVLGEIWSASYLTMNWWCFLSIVTCACVAVMDIWALYWNLGAYAGIPVHISDMVCIIRWSNDWWSGTCSIFIINSSCSTSMLPQSAVTVCSECHYI